MKVVGLLSGGKDSVYNLLQCIINGHEPIALASLGPGPGKDEIDSYMYQTVGHSGLHAIADAIGVPLFTGIISGTPKNLESDYGSREGTFSEKGKGKSRGTEGDETEDLYELLLKVKIAMPEVEAVACGAILSNYQRVRVEHICTRLGLTSIAYLWEQEQGPLLSSMVAHGMESILVKVAGAGLRVEHLGKTLAEMQPTLIDLNRKFQLHICGEGGEYETFTLDCPIFKRRLVLDEVTTIITNSDRDSTIAHLKIEKCSLAYKPDHPLNETFQELQIRIRNLVTAPEILDENSSILLPALRAIELQKDPLLTSSRIGTTSTSTLEVPQIDSNGDWIAFGSIVTNLKNPTLEEEVHSCFQILSDLLHTKSATLLSISHLNLYLSKATMSKFTTMNEIYKTYFGSSPPTRACIAILVDNSADYRIKLEGIGKIGQESRKSLHIQSISYWSAANIGPYSQTITTGNRVFMAGQIPLIPASLTLIDPPDFSMDCILSWQHVRKIVIAASEGRWKSLMDSAICWLANVTEDSEWKRRIDAARYTFDPSVTLKSSLQLLILSAEILPRGASIEWQVTHQTLIEPEEAASDDEEEPELDLHFKEIHYGHKRSFEQENGLELAIDQSSSGDTIGFYALTPSIVKSKPSNLLDIGTVYSIRAFHLPSISTQTVIETAQGIFGKSAAITTIAVARIATSHQDSYDLAFSFMGKSLA